MGVNVQIGGGGTGSGAGQKPKKVKKTDRCKNVPKSGFISDFTDEELADMEDQKEQQGQPMPQGWPRTRVFEALLPGAPNPVYTIQTARAPLGDELNQDVPGFNVEDSGGKVTGELTQPQGSQGDWARTYPSGGEFEDDGDYVAEKTKIKRDGPRTKVFVKGRDKKAKALKRKVQERYGDDMIVSDIVQDLVGKYLPGVSVEGVSNIDVPIKDIWFNETFLNQAFNRCALMGDAEWYLSSDDTMHFFRPEDRFNNEPITTNWNMGKGATEEVITPNGELARGEDSGKFDGQYRTYPYEPNVEEDSAEVEADGGAIKNRIQVFNPAHPTERQEPIPIPTTPYGPTPDESHLTYAPMSPTPLPEGGWQMPPGTDMPLATAISGSIELPIATPLPVYMDWTDRPNTTLYEEANHLSGPAIDEGFVAPVVGFFNFEEGSIRWGANPYFGYVNGYPPEPNPPAPPIWEAFWPAGETGIINVTYTYAQSTYFVMNDSPSQEKYGMAEHILVTPAGHTVDEMKKLAQDILREWSQPRVTLDVTMLNDRYKLGQTVDVNIPELGLRPGSPAPRMKIFERTKEWDAEHLNQQWPGKVKLRLGQKPMTFDQYLGQFMNGRVSALEEPYMRRGNPRREYYYIRKQLGMIEYFRYQIRTTPITEIDVGEIDVGDIEG